MKSTAITSLAFALVLVGFVPACVHASICSNSISWEHSMTQSWLSFPKTLEDSLGNTTGAVLKISLQESHSLKLEQYCDCRPPCAEGTSQYTSLKLTGMTALFGGEVGWEEELVGCEPGDGGDQMEMRTVYQSFSHAEGRGRWFGGGSPAVVTVGVEVVRTVALFGFSLQSSVVRGSAPKVAPTTQKQRRFPGYCTSLLERLPT